MLNATRSSFSATGRLQSLRPYWLRSNWHVDQVKLPHYLVRSLGNQVDSVAENLVSTIRNKQIPGLKLGWAGGVQIVPGVTRAVRVGRELLPGHVTAVDVNLHSQGGDLYIRFDAVARTRIVVLRRTLYMTLFLTLFSLGCSVLLNLTSARNALVGDYVNKYGGATQRTILREEILTGRFQNGGPWSYAKLFSKDPLLFVTAMGKVPALLGAGIGFLLFMIPKDSIRHPCRWLGWPTPDLFRNNVLAHQANIEAALSDTLTNNFQIYADQLQVVNHA